MVKVLVTKAVAYRILYDVALLAFLILATYNTFQTNANKNDIEVLAKANLELSQSNTRALCAFRGDLERRVRSSREFLKDNPNGIPGISGKSIQVSIDNLEETINNFQFLKCNVVKG